MLEKRLRLWGRQFCRSSGLAGELPRRTATFGTAFQASTCTSETGCSDRPSSTFRKHDTPVSPCLGPDRNTWNLQLSYPASRTSSSRTGGLDPSIPTKARPSRAARGKNLRKASRTPRSAALAASRPPPSAPGSTLLLGLGSYGFASADRSCWPNAVPEFRCVQIQLRPRQSRCHGFAISIIAASLFSGSPVNTSRVPNLYLRGAP